MKKLLVAAFASAALIPLSLSSLPAQAVPASTGAVITVQDGPRDVRLYQAVHPNSYEKVGRAETDIKTIDYKFKNRVLTSTITMRAMYPRTLVEGANLEWDEHGRVSLANGKDLAWGMTYQPGFKYGFVDFGTTEFNEGYKRCATTVKPNHKTNTVRLTIDFKTCAPTIQKLDVQTTSYGGSRHKVPAPQKEVADINYRDTSDRVGLFR